MPITIQPLAESIGAEIIGLDLTQPASDADKRAVREAWQKHLVLVIRGQKIKQDEHIAFARILGQLDVDNPNTVFGDGKHPEIFVLTNETKDGKPSETRDIGWQWHADLTYTTRPSAGAVLHAISIPERGGDTMFCNMQKAYETLSDKYKSFLREAEAIHDITNGQWFNKRDVKTIEAFASKNRPVVQPMVSIHPESGRPSLLIGETAVSQIVGMTVAESAPILSYLTQHATQPEFVYRHNWKVGDLLVWDNRCTMHKVVADHSEVAEPGSQGQIRRMHRVTLLGLPSGRALQSADMIAA